MAQESRKKPIILVILLFIFVAAVAWFWTRYDNAEVVETAASAAGAEPQASAPDKNPQVGATNTDTPVAEVVAPPAADDSQDDTQAVATETTTAEAEPEETPPASDDAETPAETDVVETPSEAPEVTVAAPTFDLVRIENDGFSVIAGRAAKGGTVTIEVDGQVVEGSETTVGSDGKFAMLVELPRKAQVQVLELVHLPDNVPPPVRSSQRLFVDPSAVLAEAPVLGAPSTDAVATPTITTDSALALNNPEKPRVLMADENGLRVLPTAREPAKVSVVALDTISYTNDGEVALGGRGAGDGFVRVYLDNKPITTAPIKADGYFSIDLPDVDSGVYTLRVDELSADGVVESRIETPFKREEPETLRALIAPLAEGEAPVDFKVKTVQPGATLWAIAQERYGSGTEYVKVFEANRDRIKNPDLIYPGQVFDTPD